MVPVSPNYRAALVAAMPLLFHVAAHSRGASERGRSVLPMRALLIGLGMLVTVSGARGQLTDTFWYRGRLYRLEVKPEVFRSTPTWDTEAQANPPVAASQALKEAFRFTTRLEQQSGWEYHLDGLTLIQPGSQWYWEARFSHYRDLDGLRKGDEQTRCWILMDGTVVEPVLVENATTKGFRVIPPVPDADPSTRKPVSVQLPTAMHLNRRGDTLTVSFPSIQATNLMVGYKMLTGIAREDQVVRDGIVHIRDRRRSIQEGLALESAIHVLTLGRDEIPKAGQKFILECRVTVFETDLPSQHMWVPETGKHYKILWTRTFSEAIR
jgi:hypothetical protein